jgi:hypothetical protein
LLEQREGLFDDRDSLLEERDSRGGKRDSLLGERESRGGRKDISDPSALGGLLQE